LRIPILAIDIRATGVPGAAVAVAWPEVAGSEPTGLELGVAGVPCSDGMGEVVAEETSSGWSFRVARKTPEPPSNVATTPPTIRRFERLTA
jgi:hypothetical protein